MKAAKDGAAKNETAKCQTREDEEAEEIAYRTIVWSPWFLPPELSFPLLTSLAVNVLEFCGDWRRSIEQFGHGSLGGYAVVSVDMNAGSWELLVLHSGEIWL